MHGFRVQCYGSVLFALVLVSTQNWAHMPAKNWANLCKSSLGMMGNVLSPVKP